MIFLAALSVKVRAALATVSAVVLVLLGAYYWGGRAAKKAVAIKEAHEENKRLNETVKVGHDNEIKISRKSADTVHSELDAEWMRD